VIAVSDEYGAIANPLGIDIPALEDHVTRVGTVTGFQGGDALEGDNLLELPVDLLVPAAVEGVIGAHNAARIRARVIVEGANGPTSPDADRILQEAGILVVPDILANAGGVLVSYFEWVQANQAYWWSAHDVEERLKERMLQSWEYVRTHSSRLGVPLRQAATALAVERVAQAHELRGLYP
jgi:glutamate dehydrogenase (NAD(P)+)